MTRPSILVLLLGLATVLALPSRAEPRRQGLASQRISQRVPAAPIGRGQQLKAEQPEEAAPEFTARRTGQTEVRPGVSTGTSGIKKKRLVTLDID